MGEEGTTQVQRLRVRGVSNKSPTVRLVLSSLLNSVDLRPVGMSPSAVLIVRSMADPLPGRVTLHRRAVRVDARWEHAAQQALADLLRRAARPGRHPVPANAAAVLFADEGEMLAWLALDMSRGEVQERWWWRAMRRTLPSSSSMGLTTLLCTRATSVPAALHHLAVRGQAVTVARALSPRQAMAVLAAMGQAYGIDDFRLGSPRPAGSAETQASGRRDLQTRDAPGQRHHHGRYTPQELQPPRLVETVSWPAGITPWASMLVPPGLGKERTCLLGVAMSLHTRPSMVRSSAFLRRLGDWWTGTAAFPARPASRAPFPEHAVRPPAHKQSSVGEGEALMAPQGQLILDENAVPPPLLADMNEEHGRSAGRRSGPDSESQPGANDQDRVQVAGGRGTGTANQPVESSQSTSASDNRVMPPRLEVPREKWQQPGQEGPADGQPQTIVTNQEQPTWATRPQEVALLLEGGVPTALGGVLYLINLMQHLDLPACFEADWELASQVGAWGVLEALGRGLLTAESAHLSADPLWIALAQLDGREPGQLPRAALPGSDHFRLPLAWLTHTASAEGAIYYWATRRQRLRVWAAPGYILLDYPVAEAPPETQVREALRAYERTTASTTLAQQPCDQSLLDPPITPLVEGLHPQLSRWLSMVLPYIRFRLHQSLRLAAHDTQGLEEILLRWQGQLYVTSTHVDLVMRLDDISLPVRLAGLDRHPGWMPDFARVVQFHFT